MSYPSIGAREARGRALLLGPAVSARFAPESAPATRLEEPLPPFVRPDLAGPTVEVEEPVTTGTALPEPEPDAPDGVASEAAEPEVVAPEAAAPEAVEPEAPERALSEFEWGEPPAADPVPTGSVPAEPVQSGAPAWEEESLGIEHLDLEDHLPAELRGEAFGADELGLVRGADWGLSTGAGEMDEEGRELVLDEEAGEPAPMADLAALAEASLAVSAPAETAPVEPALVEEPPFLAEEVAPPVDAAAEEAWSYEGPPVEPEAEAVAEPEPAPAASPLATREGTLPSLEPQEEDAPVMQEVAGRLERIARALREGRPIELFASGSSDPLEVLIAGYALGYSEAFRRVKEERRRQEE